MRRETDRLFENDGRDELWAHLAQLHKLAEAKVFEIKDRQRLDPYLSEKWLKVAATLKSAADGIRNI